MLMMVALNCNIAGMPIPPDTGLAIQTASGAYVRSDNLTSWAYAAAGSGTTDPETFLAYHSAALGDRSLIVPGEPVLLQSQQTGQWCRLAPLPGSPTLTSMVCDQLTPDLATVMVYTGKGLAFNGTRLEASGPGQLLLLPNSSTGAHQTPALVTGPITTANNLTFTHMPVSTSECNPDSTACMRPSELQDA
jgi:hypothetical protein